MCRIAGFWDFNKNLAYDQEKVMINMRDVMSYGGPDDAGIYLDREAQLALGHRRLSIIELTAMGHQPMRFQHLEIVFNGEIYNYKEVREQLKLEGYQFESDSDTEVILRAYHRWGTRCCDKFRGMWAFAIWNKEKRELCICRDRMGVKPLYWYMHNGLFLFASELKAFHEHPGFYKEINQESLGYYLKYSYIPSPRSIFNYTSKLAPGTFLTVSETGEIREEAYWSIDQFYLNGFSDRGRWMNRPEEEIAEELEGVLTESFKLRMVSDVPVGMFLSGGIDSSLVTALLQKEYSTPLRTFTIGFNERQYNEADWAKKVAIHLGTNHTELYCTPKEAFDVIPMLSDIYDEPFGDSSAIPTFLVSRMASKHVKVVLSADGGDEQFCGYPRFLKVGRIADMPAPMRKLLGWGFDKLQPQQAERVYRLFKFALPDWKNFRDKYAKMREAMVQPDGLRQFDVTKSYFLDRELNALGSQVVSQLNGHTQVSGDTITQLMRLDMKYSLIDDMLTKVDRAGMRVALENREPFLDNKVVEYSSQLPLEYKYRDGKTKYILRKILFKYVPKELIERPKMGFEVPMHDWFRAELKDIYAEYLSSKRIREGGLFNVGYVESLKNEYLRGGMVDSRKLWLLCNFEMWRSRWM
ncbi:MAG TPA: asparagine synthase (glutamine-hydrolyzing) [Cyclobacteriaceae bacterium]|nr:asparagine synthase (glutamine-hydrolyzing) [Cyclobacteriaceae bacterium]